MRMARAKPILWALRWTDVSLSVRYGDGGTRYAFLINNSAADKRLCLSELNGGTELLTGTVINDLIELKPYGVDVIALR